MGTSPADASVRGLSKSPRPVSSPSPRQGLAPDAKIDRNGKLGSSPVAESSKPLAPPPRPGQPPQQQQQQEETSSDYFATQPGGSLSLEPNPFEQSFGGSGPETPGGTKLPPVASLTSPSSLLPGSNATPFHWGSGSLRTGPLSPAMLSGPANDYFGDTHHLRGGFPTPNESSLRSGLTPGGSGSMFPSPSPNTQAALFSQMASGGATPNTLDFHRTALSAAVKRDPDGGVPQSGQQHPPAVSQPRDMANGLTTIKADTKPASGPFDPHDNDAANGLFMLAQGRNGNRSGPHFSVTTPPGHAHPRPAPPPTRDSPPPMPAAGGPALVSLVRGGSEGSILSDSGEQGRSMTMAMARGKGKKGASISNGRRKADDIPAKSPSSKRVKGVGNSTMSLSDVSSEEDGRDKNGENGSKSKMTDDEKRKNFLERNRVAALKCRQRKKQWLANLQSKVEIFSTENDALTAQIAQLREEVVNLKTLLLAHKDCPITQQQGLQGAFMSQVVEPYNPQINPYGMAGPVPNQQVMSVTKTSRV